MYKQLSSLQNPSVKRILQLQDKSRARKKEGLFVVEGKRETVLALEGEYEISEVFFCEALCSAHEVHEIIQHRLSSSKITEITAEVYSKIAYRGSTEGIIAIFKAEKLLLENLKLSSDNVLILVAEAPEKPGNIGALLRTADAAALDAVLIANPKTDMFNPNIIRSSVGCVFTNKIATGSTSEIIEFLKEHKIKVFAAELEASKSYLETDFTESSAIIVGTEATGLSEEWLENSDQNIIIPMEGKIDSMNVSVAAGILIFEAKRQRRN